jgi:hypothetical protein
MANRHDVANSPVSPEIGQRHLAEKTNLTERNYPWWYASRQTTTGGMTYQSRLAAIVCATSFLMCAASAHADPTPRSFVGNFIGNDATVENYLTVSGSYDRAQNAESLYLEKTISPKSSFSIFVGYQRLEQEGEQTGASGFSNLGLAYKRVLITLPRHEFVFTVNPSLEVPVGSSSVGSESHPRAGGVICFFRRALEICPTHSACCAQQASKATRDGKAK